MREPALPTNLLKNCGQAIACLVFAAVVATSAHAAITITGVQSQPVQFSIDDLRKLPARKVRVGDKGKEVEYEGVAVAAVLTKAGMELGKAALHGKRLTQYLIVQARDGYQVLLAIPEIDPEVTDRIVLLCYARNGLPLPENEGPLRLILAEEKSQARWVRQVSAIALRAHGGP
jgi:DMSO/TMAO reductase YedYZ molybdopterin-dependent catalytic subunit